MNEISPIVNTILGEGYAISKDAAAPDALLVRSASLHDFPRSGNLLAIARAGAGVNNIPIDECSSEGVVVFNTPGANANAVAELVVAAMLMTGRDILGAVEWVRTLKGEDDATVSKKIEKEKNRFVGPELRGKTLGVIGLGAIGALVANSAIGLGMEVYGYDPFISVEHAWALSRSIRRVTNRDELISNCDFISVHVPLISETRGMFNQAMFARMKGEATLLNFSRGELVDCAAVVEAVRSGKLRAYATDFPCEAMIGQPGILCIPHLGASTPESEENCARMAAEQIREYLEHGVIRNSINLPDVDLPRSDANRVTIIHQNIPKVLGAITGVMAGDDINIANLINKSKGLLAYTVLDIDGAFTDAQIDKLNALESVLRVRTV
jgi:D-3-phosphoglycerate dehydrogenase